MMKCGNKRKPQQEFMSFDTSSITDFVFEDDQSLRCSLAMIPGIVCPRLELTAGWGLKYYRRKLEISSQWH